MKRMLLVIICVFSLMFVMRGAPFSFIEPVNAVGPADVRIVLNETSVFLEPGPGETDELTFEGLVAADIPWIPEVQSLIVNIEATVEDWDVTVTDQLIFTKGVDELPITVVVHVPADISGAFKLEVAGNWTYDPGVENGECTSDQVIIYVNEFPEIGLGCENPMKQVQRGSSVSYSVMVLNDGDVEVWVRVTILNLEDLANEDMAIQMSQEKVLVPAKEMKNITISIHTSTTTTLETYKIELHAEMVDPETEEPIGVFTEFDLLMEVVAYDPNPEPEPEPEPEPTDDDEEPEPTDDDDELPPANETGGDDDDVDNTTGVVNNDQGIPTIAIIGIIAVIVVLAVVIIIVLFSLGRKRRKLLKE